MGHPVRFVGIEDRVPWIRTCLDAAAAHDWHGLRTTIATNATCPDDVNATLSTIADANPADTGAWLRDLDADAGPDLLRTELMAEVLIGAAWLKRSHARARDLSEHQISEFSAGILAAEHFLTKQIGHHPTDEHLWASRISTGVGASVGLSEITRRHRRLATIDPNSFAGARRYLLALLPKWYGTYPDTLQFARTTAAHAAPGSLLRSLPALYYADHWLMEPDDQAKQLLARNDVREELVRAGLDSVLNPTHRPTAYGLHMVSTLALLLSLGGWWADAWPYYHILGSTPVSGFNLWETMRDAPQTYLKFFDRARQAGQP
ncbi:MAG: hypothetical protein LBV06_07355 [Propionibacteriaceae bacterium]|jgi:hypothetical protein|nr:hypothetical protein [Propionibacteriaceae bacterium]